MDRGTKQQVISSRSHPGKNQVPVQSGSDFDVALSDMIGNFHQPPQIDGHNREDYN